MPHRAQRSQSAQTKSADCCGDASVLASLLRKSRMPVVALIFCSLRSISIRTNCTADAGVALTKINTPCDHGLSRRMFGRGSGTKTLRTAPMSALPPIADIRQCNCDVRFVPKADNQRSISPNTMSRELSIAGTSASMCPRVKKSIAPKCGYDGARILHLYGWLVPSETR